MKKEYPYRFKTKKELETEYGDDKSTIGGFWGKEKWRTGNGEMVSCSWISDMDYLFGEVYPYNITKDIKDMDLPIVKHYHVNWFMLTKNKIEPNYKPKEKIVRSL